MDRGNGKRVVLARLLLLVLFSLLWIMSLPRRAVGLSPPLVRLAWLRQLLPDFGSRAILWHGQRSEAYGSPGHRRGAWDRQARAVASGSE